MDCLNCYDTGAVTVPCKDCKGVGCVHCEGMGERETFCECHYGRELETNSTEEA